MTVKAKVDYGNVERIFDTGDDNDRIVEVKHISHKRLMVTTNYGIYIVNYGGGVTRTDKPTATEISLMKKLNKGRR